MRVLIDAGHGIDTPGKRSPDGRLLEYLWNRQVADLVIEGLQDHGIGASLVVRESNDISLRTRAMRVNRACAEYGDAVLVSIHSNAAGDGSRWMTARGWSCYTSPGKTGADALAECLYDAFEEYFPDRRIRKDLTDGDRDWEANFYILTKTRCPAVLIENFFYDNREECAWLLREDTKAEIAEAIVSGLIRYGKRQ